MLQKIFTTEKLRDTFEKSQESEISTRTVVHTFFLKSEGNRMPISFSPPKKKIQGSS